MYVQFTFFICGGTATGPSVDTWIHEAVGTSSLTTKLLSLCSHSICVESNPQMPDSDTRGTLYMSEQDKHKEKMVDLQEVSSLGRKVSKMNVHPFLPTNIHGLFSVQWSTHCTTILSHKVHWDM